MKTIKEMIDSFESYDLQKAWTVYVEQCYPPDIPECQRRELHKTFFSGALVMYVMMLHISELEEDKAIAFLEHLRDQLDQMAAKYIVPDAAKN